MAENKKVSSVSFFNSRLTSVISISLVLFLLGLILLIGMLGNKLSVYVKILPLKKEHMQTYAHMEINEAQGHKDPSDHVIIAHAITEHLPLISSDTRFGFYRSQGLDLVFNQK